MIVGSLIRVLESYYEADDEIIFAWWGNETYPNLTKDQWSKVVAEVESSEEEALTAAQELIDSIANKEGGE